MIIKKTAPNPNNEEQLNVIPLAVTSRNIQSQKFEHPLSESQFMLDKLKSPSTITKIDN